VTRETDLTEGIHWPDLDEDISVENMLLGKAPAKVGDSFRRRLEKRTVRS